MIHTDEDDEFARIERENQMKGQPYHWEADAIKAALEAKDEPVAEVTSETGADITMSWWHEPALPMGTKLYTTPPQRTWVGLTEDEAIELLPIGDWEIESTLEFAQAIEAKLKEKNT